MAAAVAAGVTTLALTDHDTTGGWAEAAAAVAALPPGTTLVPGAEFSTRSPDGRGGTVTAHLLGYLFDPSHPELRAEQSRLRVERRERVRRMGALMAGGGLPIDGDALLAHLPADSPAGRPHLARALVEAGVVASVGEAFDDLLRTGGPYYLPKDDTPIATAITLIRAAGGVPVFAHPWARRRGPVIDGSVLADLAGRGLAGVEVDHPDHDAADRAALRTIAAAHGLFTTGSSDHHGRNKTTPIAAETTAPEVLEVLLAQATGTAPVAGGRPAGAS